MIVLVFSILSMIVIPMAVEKVRSPEDNLAGDVKEEFAEKVARPLGNKVMELRTRATASAETLARATLLTNLLKMAIEFVLGVVQRFLKFFD
jgi:K+-transporting ATPase A subunit